MSSRRSSIRAQRVVVSLQSAILFFLFLALAQGAAQPCSAAPATSLDDHGLPPHLYGVPTAVDINPDPNVVEIHLEAAPSVHSFKPGEPVHVWAYNGSVPGPLIEGKVGDTLIVHFTNNLPEPTTVHWHGLEVPAEMDGTGISQEAAEPNGGQFRYEFKLLTPALYWYHPHIQTNEQVEKGLYGPLLVRGGDETTLDLPEDEYVLVLDDVLLDEDGQIAEPFPADPLARAEMQLNGREGNLLLVNGQHLPTLNVKAGWPLRWRIVNAANARLFRLRVPEHLLYRIGGDGGLLEDPVRLDPWNMVLSPAHHALPDLTEQQTGLMLTPGERADVVFTPRGEPGTQLTVYWIDFPRGAHVASYNNDGTIAVGHTPLDGRRDPVPLLRLNLVASDAWDGGHYYVPPADLRVLDIVEPDPELDPLTIRFGHTPPDPNGNVTFFAAMRAVDGQMMGLPFDQVTPADALHPRWDRRG